MNLTPELALAKKAAEAAGDIIRKYFEQGISSETKTQDGNQQGQVTQADVEAERVIASLILDEFPSHQILAEEEHALAGESAEHLWIIDPIDGTNNFAHGIPHFAVSIAYYRDGQPSCGVVYEPVRDDWYVTSAGQGSWYNGEPAKVSRESRLDETLVALGFYYDRGEMMKHTLTTMQELFEQQVRGVRRFGSATLDLVYVGTGRFGGYFEYTLSPWDFAAARLFVEEAGGKVSDCFGNELKLQKTSVLATNSILHGAMLDITRGHATELEKRIGSH